jgi:DNA-binding GntR family transcriptional regulator
LSRGAAEFPSLEQPPPLREQAYDAIERLILSRVLRPGEHLPEGELAARLGISRNPVREALHALRRTGWVELRPRQGAFVRSPTAAEVEQFFHVRAVLEIESARLAAERADAGTVAALRAHLEDGARARERGGVEALVEANVSFHAAVRELAGNNVLAELLAHLDKRLRWYFAPVAVVRGPDSWREHAELLEALAGHDVERAAATTRAHTERTLAAYLAQDDGRAEAG